MYQTQGAADFTRKNYSTDLHMQGKNKYLITRVSGGEAFADRTVLLERRNRKVETVHDKLAGVIPARRQHAHREERKVKLGTRADKETTLPLQVLRPSIFNCANQILQN